MKKNLSFIHELIIQSLKEQREVQQLTEQLDALRNLENDPRVVKYIASISKHLENVPMEKKLEVISNFLQSIGVDDEFETMKGGLSNQIKKKDEEEKEELGGLHSPVDVKPVLEGKDLVRDLAIQMLKEMRSKS